MAMLRASHGGFTTATVGQDVADYQYLFRKRADDDQSSKPKGLSDADYMECLKALGSALTMTTGDCWFALPAGKLSDVPPSHTYFGQFIDHDVSAPFFASVAKPKTRTPDTEFRQNEKALVDELEQKSRPDNCAKVLGAVKNFWTQPLNLQSLYGGGPDDLDPDIQAMYEGGFFKYEKVEDLSDEALEKNGLKPDLVKRLKGVDILRRENEPLLADHRNDGNLLLSQMHCQFMQFHNKIFASRGAKESDFEETRQTVTRYFHWIVLKDSLPRIIDEKVLRRVIEEAKSAPIMTRPEVPVEFTAAAFRFGHSMIRQCYDYNANFGADSPFDTMAHLDMLFQFTSSRELRGGKRLPSHWAIDWQRMNRPSSKVFFSNAIDNHLANAMNELETLPKAAHFFRQIGTRNLLRGFMRRVPCGQDLAEELGVDALPRQALKLSDDHLAGLGGTDDIERIDASKYTEKSPAWYYFLCEADALNDGQRLGPVASEIIARTIVGLIQNHPLNILGSGWKPSQESVKDRRGRSIDTLERLLMCTVE